MDIQRKTVLQVAVSVAIGLLFVGGLLGLSSVYGSEISYENESFAGTVTGELGEPADGTVSLEGELDGQFEERSGGLALVGLIAVFIVAMPIVGYLIERSED